jgi:ribosomal protein S13
MFKKNFLKTKILTTSFNTRINFKAFQFKCFSKPYKILFKNVSRAKHHLLVKENIAFHIINKSLKGFKHKNNFPVRGQRTRTNAKTAKLIKNA